MEVMASPSASRTFPSASRPRSFSRFSRQSGLALSRKPPDQTLSSLSWMRSSGAPPNTMPPSRPFPTGSASFQLAALCRYHKIFSIFGSSFMKKIPRRRCALCRGKPDALSDGPVRMIIPVRLPGSLQTPWAACQAASRSARRNSGQRGPRPLPGAGRSGPFRLR